MAVGIYWKFLIIAVGVAVSAGMMAIFIHDLWQGQTSFGRWRVRRTDDSTVYWSILFFYVAGMTLLFIVTGRMATETMGCDPDLQRPCSVTIRAPSK